MTRFQSLSAVSISAFLLHACSDPAVPVVTPEVTASKLKKEIPAKITVKSQNLSPKPVIKPIAEVEFGKLTSVDIGQLYAMKEAGKVFLVDVRPPLYHRLGNIEGSDSLPLIKYDKTIEMKRLVLDTAVKEGKVIVLYCQNINCPDAHKTGVKLTKLGYSVSTYSGGWEEWKEAGL